MNTVWKKSIMLVFIILLSTNFLSAQYPYASSASTTLRWLGTSWGNSYQIPNSDADHGGPGGISSCTAGWSWVCGTCPPGAHAWSPMYTNGAAWVSRDTNWYESSIGISDYFEQSIIIPGSSTAHTLFLHVLSDDTVFVFFDPLNTPSTSPAEWNPGSPHQVGFNYGYCTPNGGKVITLGTSVTGAHTVGFRLNNSSGKYYGFIYGIDYDTLIESQKSECGYSPLIPPLYRYASHSVPTKWWNGSGWQNSYEIPCNDADYGAPGATACTGSWWGWNCTSTCTPPYAWTPMYQKNACWVAPDSNSWWSTSSITRYDYFEEAITGPLSNLTLNVLCDDTLAVGLDVGTYGASPATWVWNATTLKGTKKGYCAPSGGKTINLGSITAGTHMIGFMLFNTAAHYYGFIYGVDSGQTQQNDTCCYTFRQGYNFISIPFTDSPPITFASLFPASTTVWDWTGSGYTVIPLSTIIDPNKGYWIQLMSDEYVCVSGTRVTSWSLPISPGWNTVGSVACDCQTGANLPTLPTEHLFAAFQWDPLSGFFPAYALSPPYGTFLLTDINANLIAHCNPNGIELDTSLAFRKLIADNKIALSETINSWFGMLNVTDEISHRYLDFSGLLNASSGYDKGIDTPVPPPPPFFNPDTTFDAWFEVETPVPMHLSKAINTRTDSMTWKVRLSGREQWIIPQWQNIKPWWNIYLISESNQRYDLRAADTIHLTGSHLYTLQVLKHHMVQYNVKNKWNLLSIPKIIGNRCKSYLYPTACSNAFTYNSELGYVICDTLEQGYGYWVKFPADQTIMYQCDTTRVDTIDVVEGWNIIGSISFPVPVSKIRSIPPNINTSDFFKYDNGYLPEDTIMPGGACWVKVKESGKLILNSASGTLSTGRISIIPTSELPPPAPEQELPKTELPTQFALEQNYPNPFNPVTVINYSLPINCFVTLKIYNTVGEEVATLVNGMQGAGFKSVEWNAPNLPSGIYLYRLNAGNRAFVKKMVLVK